MFRPKCDCSLGQSKTSAFDSNIHFLSRHFRSTFGIETNKDQMSWTNARRLIFSSNSPCADSRRENVERCPASNSRRRTIRMWSNSDAATNTARSDEDRLTLKSRVDNKHSSFPNGVVHTGILKRRINSANVSSRQPTKRVQQLEKKGENELACRTRTTIRLI